LSAVSSAAASVTPHLRQGSRVAVVSPASYAKPDLIAAGVTRLRRHGYDPIVMPNALARGPLYYAGTPAERLADLHAAFADKSIDGIICTRGGWGSAELLPLLDRDLISANPKPFIGYSDHTSLHTWLWNECGLRTFYAPMVAADWSKPDGVDYRSWDAALEARHFGIWSLIESDGLTVLRSGTASGRLMGGCLSILTESLGTPYAFRLTEPSILFLEDIGTKPYKWDRLIQHLRFAGIFEHVTGVVFGDMSQNIEPNEMELMQSALLHALGDFRGPVAMGLKCGHLDSGNRSLILGAPVELICEVLPSLEFLKE
jgi:muramoyltetrapeptide carboxypeptidase